MDTKTYEAIDVATRWSTNEAHIQAYRSSMISSQSFLLAVAAILLDKSKLLFAICAVVALIQLLYIWYPIIRRRTIISDYYSNDLMHRFSECGKQEVNCEGQLQVETYVKNKTVRKKVNEQLAKSNPKLKHNFRRTRIKVDLLLPASFALIWVSFLCIGIWF